MSSGEIEEIKQRAELICASEIDGLRTKLRAIQRKNAADGMLRSSRTVTDSATASVEVLRAYFSQLEEFVRSRPRADVGFEKVILNEVNATTEKLVNELAAAISSAANAAGIVSTRISTVVDFQKESETAKAYFASNLRAYWASLGQGEERSKIETALFALEIIFFGAMCVTVGLWINDPAGAYEAWLAAFSLATVALDFARRRRK